jgi:hypothetical protein
MTLLPRHYHARIIKHYLVFGPHPKLVGDILPARVS